MSSELHVVLCSRGFRYSVLHIFKRLTLNHPTCMANRPFSPSSPVSMHNKTSQGWVDNFIQISDQYFEGPNLKLLPL